MTLESHKVTLQILLSHVRVNLPRQRRSLAPRHHLVGIVEGDSDQRFRLIVD